MFCAAASDSDVVGEGVGGRSVSNDIERSLTRLVTCGFMPVGLGAGRMMG